MKNFIYPVLLFSSMVSCIKDKEQLPDHATKLIFTMDGKNYSFDELYEAKQYWACGLHQYETEAMTRDNQFFKINLTAVDNLLRGDYISGEEPTNMVARTCTFWYSGSGTSYTAKHFVITVTSYKDGILNARFEGGLITSGNINGEVFNK